MTEKLISDLELAEQTFLGQMPAETVEKMTGARPMRVNRRMKRFIAEKRWNAQYAFLQRLHDEIDRAKPEFEREQMEKERKALALGIEVEQLDEQNVRPALTPEYLKSIGREDLLDWGTD